MTPDANDLCVFAVKRGYIESKEIYCNPLYPTYLSLVEKYQHSPYANGILNNHVAVNPKTDCSLLSDSSEVSFVPMANVQEKTNVVSYDMVAYETVKKGFTVFQRGDLIWAKITPCMQNGKSCIGLTKCPQRSVSDQPSFMLFVNATRMYICRLSGQFCQVTMS